MAVIAFVNPPGQLLGGDVQSQVVTPHHFAILGVIKTMQSLHWDVLVISQCQTFRSPKVQWMDIIFSPSFLPSFLSSFSKLQLSRSSWPTSRAFSCSFSWGSYWKALAVDLCVTFSYSKRSQSRFLHCSSEPRCGSWSTVRVSWDSVMEHLKQGLSRNPWDGWLW